MNNIEIEVLRGAILKNPNSIIWICPVTHEIKYVKTINKHVEEGDDTLCAIFDRGLYAALYNCDLSDFKIIKDLIAN